ncbi:hypothetical protein B0J17DRAFT_770998 [Rhizoctonia solani]|nr:hypothetical protein B0J17DRAFT_770998 [Rhizoctonia solani]
MLEELNTAGRLLSSALDKYLEVCSSIQNYYFDSSLSTVQPGLSSHIATQGHLVAALEVKLHEARGTIARAHNCCPSLVPIHALLPELIGRIFYFVPKQIGRPFDWDGRPEVLSHVCSRWREVSLGSPSLWRCINIPFTVHEDYTLVCINRGLAFAERARPLFLDVRFYTASKFKMHSILSKPEGLKPFAEAITPYTRSLEFAFTPGDYIMYYSSILDTYRDFPVGIFVDKGTYVSDRTTDSCWLYTPDDTDPVLEPLNVLRLKGAYPPWTSKAYYGLVELRLAHSITRSTAQTPLISKKHLQGILRASPALRVLQFSIGVAQLTPTDSHVIPVPLDHLEVLSVVHIKDDKLGIFLR